MRKYRQDLPVSKFLSDLSPSLQSQARGQILGENSIPILTATFSRIMRVSIRADMSPTPSIEQSVMVSGRGRVVMATVILQEDVAHLEVIMVPMPVTDC